LVFLKDEVIAAMQPLAIGGLREIGQTEIPGLFSNLAVDLLRIRTQRRSRHRARLRSAGWINPAD
jgi:hypothetical protein